MKKFFAALLAMIMVLSLVPATIFAAESVCPGEDETHNADNCVATAVETKEAVCGEWGYTIYKCDTCGAQYADDFVKGDSAHDWDEGKVTTEPDCDSEGVKTYTCAICEGTKTESVKALGHKYETTEGIGCAAKQVCSVCGDEKDAGEHTWGLYPSAILEEPYVDANGKAVDGLAEYTCIDCGDVKHVIIICEHDHKVELKSEAIAPDCTTDGQYAIYWCAVCQKEYLDEDGVQLIEDEDEKVDPKLGHDCEEVAIEGEPCHVQDKCTREGCDYTGELKHDHPREDVAGVYAEEATCTKYGYVLFACKNCGDTWSESTKPLGHDEVTVVIPGTCTYPGYTFTYCANGKKCDIYGKTLTEEFVPSDASKYYRTSNKDAIAAGLKYDVTIVVDKATVGVALIKVEDNKDVDADKHYIQKNVIQEATCYASGLTVEHCVLCGYHKETVVPALGHDFTEKKDGSNVEVKATANCTEGGSKIITCANGCTLTKEVTSEALGHAWQTLSSRLNCKYGELANNDGVYYEHAYQVCTECDASQTVVLNTWDGVTIPSYFATVEDAKYYHGSVKFNWVYDEKGNFVEKTIHADSVDNFTEGEVYNEPTCTEVGYQSYTCDDCGLKFFVEIPMDAHVTENEENIKAEVPAECYKDGVKAHNICDACGAKHIDGKAVADEDLVIPAAHGELAEIAAREPGCQELPADFWEKMPQAGKDGVKPVDVLNYYLNAGFGCDKLSYCTVCGAIFDGDWELAPMMLGMMLGYRMPGHDLVTYEYVAPTCQNPGKVGYSICTKCDFVEYTGMPEITGGINLPGIFASGVVKNDKGEIVEIVPFELAALNHGTYLPSVSISFNMVGTYCGQNVWVLSPFTYSNTESAIVEVDAHSPKCPCKRDDHHSCDKITYTHYMCTLCEKEWIEDYKPAAEGHTNKAGELILDICDPAEDADRHCVICDKDIAAKGHDIVTVVVDATCVADGYTLYYCKNCDYRKVIESDIDLMDPDKHPADSIVEDLESGVAYCELCGKILGKAVAIIPTTDVEVVADGSTFTVQVVINATELEVWGLKFDLLYEAEVLELVDAKIASENFTYAGQINDFIYDEWLGVISVALNAEDDVLVDGEQLVLEATFKVNNIYGYDTAHFATYAENDWDDPNALNKDGEPIWAIGFELEIELDLFLDVDDDGIAATMLDALAMYELILANEYYAPADTDGDGVITMVDLLNLYDVIVGKTTADALLGREPVEAPEEVPAE